jgi:hypothetical protein
MTITSRTVQAHAAGRPHQRCAGPSRRLAVAKSRAAVPGRPMAAIAQVARDPVLAFVIG